MINKHIVTWKNLVDNGYSIVQDIHKQWRSFSPDGTMHYWGKSKIAAIRSLKVYYMNSIFGKNKGV